jgi:outer membrane protein assembly factor BamB
MLLAITPASAAGGRDAWPQFRGNAAHTGVNAYETQITLRNVDKLELKWVGNNGFNSSPAVADDVVYVSNGGLHAYPAHCGTGGQTCPPLWHANSGGANWASPAVAKGIVYIQGSSGLNAYRVGCRSDGGLCSPVWSNPSASAGFSSPTVSDGIVYVSTNSGFIQAYDADACANHGGTCQPTWKASLGGLVQSSPAVFNGMVYVGGGDGLLRAFRTDCGTGGATCLPKWTAAIGPTVSSPAVGGGVVYIGAYNGKLLAFPVSCRKGDGTCAPLWTADTPFPTHTSPAVTDTAVYIGAGRRLLAFAVGCGTNGQTCHPMWKGPRIDPGNDMASSPAVANGIVFIGSQENHQANGRIRAFPAHCGTGGRICNPIWESPLLPGMANPSTAVADGMVYIATNGGKTFAFGLP